MALDHLIKKAKDHFGIMEPADWSNVRPEWIRGLDGCGPATIDHLRIYLAARGLTLKDDGTPEYWQRNLSAARIGGQIAESDQAVIAPFTILIDSQEKQPWTFEGFKADAPEKLRPLIIPHEWKSLGPNHGDYSLAGFEGRVHIERKSMADAHGTFLGHHERRDRWENTLSFLSEIESSAVIVECTLGQLVANVQSRGKRSAGTLAKTIHRQVMAWMDDYRVPFLFCDNRRLAEASALRWLRRFHRHATEHRKRDQKELDAVIAAL